MNDGSVAQARGIGALQQIPAPALVVAGTLSIQFGAALAATIFDEAGAAGTTLLRLLLGSLIVMIFWKPRIRSRPAAHLRLTVLFGVTLAAMNLCVYEAIDRIPLGIVVTVEFIGPISVAAALSRRRADFVWIVLAVAGILLLTRPWGQDTGLDTIGLVLAVVAAAAWAGYILLAQRVGRFFDGGEGLILAMIVASAVTFIPGVIDGGSALVRPEVLAVGVGIALLSSAIPFSLETEALRRMSARVFGVLMSVEPAFAALAGFLVLSQKLDAGDIGAIALVVIASVGVTRSAPAPRSEAAIEA